MVPVYRLKLTAQSPSRYGLLRNPLISCKIPYGRLDTIKPELRKKKTKNNKPKQSLWKRLALLRKPLASVLLLRLVRPRQKPKLKLLSRLNSRQLKRKPLLRNRNSKTIRIR